jgi:hypothetical protein
VEDEPLLPKIDYYLDESDPDILVLHRQDDAFVAAFSVQGGHPRAHEGELSSPGRSKQGLL